MRRVTSALCLAGGAGLKWISGEAIRAHHPGHPPRARGMAGCSPGIRASPRTLPRAPLHPWVQRSWLVKQLPWWMSFKASLLLHLNRDSHLSLLAVNFVSWVGWGRERPHQWVPSVCLPSVSGPGSSTVSPAEADAPLPWCLEKRRRQDESPGASFISPPSLLHQHRGLAAEIDETLRSAPAPALSVPCALAADTSSYLWPTRVFPERPKNFSTHLSFFSKSISNADQVCALS